MKELPGEKKPLWQRELPIVSDDSEDTEQVMRELFDEEKVTHQHGGAEPEGD
tara:strand:+ start:2333 stop:2488 length:156 start_codon:yes stop_codon:yes gene_type:complete